MIKKISAKFPNEWSFIGSMLEKDIIEDTIKNFDFEGENDVFSEFELEKEVSQEPCKACVAVLMREATQEMWRRTSKEKVNNMLKSMYEINALSVKMMNGVEYTPKQLIECKETEINIKNLNYEDIDRLFTENDWFECGNCIQYEKLVDAAEKGMNPRDLAAAIWMCSEDASIDEIERKITDYLSQKAYG